MMLNRRIFIQGALGGVPALAALLSSKPLQASQASPPPAQVSGGGTDPNQIVFKIDGWDRWDTAATDNQVSIRINQSWRTAWR